MKTRLLSSIAVLTLLAVCPVPSAHAQDIQDMPDAQMPDETEFSQTPDGALVFALGYYDISGGNEALDLRLEYRSGAPVLYGDNLKPWGGAEVTTDETIWLGGGLLYDWNITQGWYVTPSFGMGLYTKGNSDLDLDYPIEFRSQIEASRNFGNNARVGASLSQISNFDLGNTNPKAEVLNVSMSYPF